MPTVTTQFVRPIIGVPSPYKPKYMTGQTIEIKNSIRPQFEIIIATYYQVSKVYSSLQSGRFDDSCSNRTLYITYNQEMSTCGCQWEVDCELYCSNTNLLQSDKYFNKSTMSYWGWSVGYVTDDGGINIITP